MNQASLDLNYRHRICCRGRQGQSPKTWVFFYYFCHKVAMWLWASLHELIENSVFLSRRWHNIVYLTSQNCYKNKRVIYKGTFQSKNDKRNTSILIWIFSHTIHALLAKQIIMTYYWLTILSKLMKRKFGSGWDESSTGHQCLSGTLGFVTDHLAHLCCNARPISRQCGTLSYTNKGSFRGFLN